MLYDAFISNNNNNNNNSDRHVEEKLTQSSADLKKKTILNIKLKTFLFLGAI